MCKSISSLLLFVLNGLVSLIGLGILIVGAISSWNKQWIKDMISKADPNIEKQVIEIIETTLLKYGLFIFIIGVIIFVISFCGCCGVWCKNRLLLGIYAGCIIVIALVFLIGLIVLGAMKNNLPSLFVATLEKLTPDNKDDLQKALKCCGIKDAAEEYKTGYPDSCCATPACTKDNIYGITCSVAISDLIAGNYNYILIAAGVLCGIFIILAAVSVYLLKRCKDSETI